MTIALWFATVVAAMAFGMASGHRKTFPFGLLVRLKHRLVRRAPAPLPARRFVVDIADMADLQARRARLTDYVFGAGGLPRQRLPDRREALAPPALPLKNVATAERWTVAMAHGIDSRVLVLTPHALRRETVVVYQQGHEGDVMHGRHVLQRLLDAGYRVAALAMPLLGANSRPDVTLRRHGTVRLDDHDFLWLVDHEFGGNSVRFFVEPVVACLNAFEADGARRFAMLGWSGGGWTTTLCAALDARIGQSFPVAGALPFTLRRRGELADYENHLPALYDIANELEQFVLAASGRHVLQILNEFDTVAWSGRRGLLYEAAVGAALQRAGGGRFSVMIDDSWVGHGISRRALGRVLDELATPS